MPGRLGQGKAALALGPQREGMGGGVHTGMGLFLGLFLVLRQGLWVALAILELCTVGWSWTQKSPLLFYVLGLKLHAL